MTHVPSSTSARTAHQRERSLEEKVGIGAGRVFGQSRGGASADVSPSARYMLGSNSNSVWQMRAHTAATATTVMSVYARDRKASLAIGGGRLLGGLSCFRDAVLVTVPSVVSREQLRQEAHGQHLRT